MGLHIIAEVISSSIPIPKDSQHTFIKDGTGIWQRMEYSKLCDKWYARINLLQSQKYNHFLFTGFEHEPLSIPYMRVSHITRCLYIVSLKQKFMPQEVM